MLATHVLQCVIVVRMQVVLVSATLPHEVLEMTHKFMTEPLRVLVKRDELTLEARARLCCVMAWRSAAALSHPSSDGGRHH